MNKKHFTSLLSLLCILAILLCSFAVAASAYDDDEEDETTVSDEAVTEEPVTGAVVTSNTVVTGVEVQNTSRASNRTLKKGHIAKITVHMKNIGIKESLFSGSISVVRPMDSFAEGGSVEFVKKASKDRYITYDLVFRGLVYSGSGNTLRFIMNYTDMDLPSESMELTISQCIESVTQTTSASPEATTASPSVPSVRINRGSIPSVINAGDEFTLEAVIKNSGTVPVGQGSVTFEPSDGLTLLEATSSKETAALAAGASQKVCIRMRAEKTAASSSQSVTASYKFTYKGSEGTQDGEASEKLLVPIVVSKTAASGSAAATPNIIVSKYSYGGAVAAGSTFVLELSFKNTSSVVRAENIVMSVETGSALSITSSSNTFYFSSLDAGKTISQKIEMLVPSNAEPETAKIDISFKYEYLNGSERETANSGEKLSIPVFLPDRFSVVAPELVVATQNQETYISLPYVNKGKGEVSNVEADLIYDEDAAGCEQPHQNLGNFAAGASGTIDILFTPYNMGEMNVTVKITYEDEMQKQKTIELPLTFNVDEEVPVDDPYWEEPVDAPEEGGSRLWIVFVCVGAAVIIIVAVIVVVKKKRKKKAASIPDDFDWGDSST